MGMGDFFPGLMGGGMPQIAALMPPPGSMPGLNMNPMTFGGGYGI
jgi:hypothetical protein